MANEDGLKVLVIEDEEEIREFLVTQFQEFGHQSMGLSGAENLIMNLESYRPNVILLDQMMPGKSGRDVIREMRSNSAFWNIPIMMVSGLNSEEEKVEALELGADDYVTKPFSIKEVIARAQALVRRFKSNQKSPTKNLSMKELVVDLAAHRVTLRSKELLLTLTEYKILVELLRQSGLVLSRDLLRERALGNLNVTDRTIDVHMASLRKKLEDMGDAIQTVRGVGYRFAQLT